MSTVSQAEGARQERGLSVFERYLTLWVALCIVGGIVLGKLAPGMAGSLDGLSLTSTARRWSRSRSPSACSS